MKMIKLLCSVGGLLLIGAWLNFANAAIIPFDLQGTAGFGLLPGNENPATTGGTGGEIGAGIFFNDVTLELTINIGWGSGNGFTDLTGDATLGHVHGPTASAAPGSFTQNASPLITLQTLGGWNPNAANGGFSGTVNVPSGNVPDLFAGKLYINVHTQANPGGEIRGYLLPVPEPSSLALVATGLGCLVAILFWRRARQTT